MQKGTPHKIKNEMSTASSHDGFASLLHDFELIAQAASHDLKDPLRQAVLDFESLKTEYQDKPLDAPAQANIQVAIDAINLVVHRIDILRTYSHVVQNKKIFSDVSCSRIIEKALDQLAPTITARKADITIGDMPETIWGNEEQLVNLFKYLVDNAMRFCPNKTPKISIKGKDNGDIWEFSINDNGIGLDPVYREFVYAIFQYLDHESPNHSDGVGLTFSKKIMQNHNGNIYYESDGENGTCFYVTFPKY